MKAFSFRLDQVLRWRAAQVDIEKAKAAAAANAHARIQAEIARLESEWKTHSAGLAVHGSNGAVLSAWSAWQTHTQTRILKLRAAEKQASTALADQMKKLTEASQRCKVIENLKTTRQAQWQAGFAKELEAFAAESYLGRLQSKRTGA